MKKKKQERSNKRKPRLKKRNRKRKRKEKSHGEHAQKRSQRWSTTSFKKDTSCQFTFVGDDVDSPSMLGDANGMILHARAAANVAQDQHLDAVVAGVLRRRVPGRGEACQGLEAEFEGEDEEDAREDGQEEGDEHGVEGGPRPRGGPEVAVWRLEMVFVVFWAAGSTHISTCNGVYVAQKASEVRGRYLLRWSVASMQGWAAGEAGQSMIGHGGRVVDTWPCKCQVLARTTMMKQMGDGNRPSTI